MREKLIKLRYAARRRILESIDGFRSRSNGTSIEEIVFYNNLKPEPLTRDEELECFQKWEGVVPRLKRGLEALACFTKINGFDPRYLPHSWYYPYVLDKLNPMHFAHAMENKAMMYNYLHQMALPKIVVLRINNSFLETLEY